MAVITCNIKFLSSNIFNFFILETYIQKDILHFYCKRQILLTFRTPPALYANECNPNSKISSQSISSNRLPFDQRKCSRLRVKVTTNYKRSFNAVQPPADTRVASRRYAPRGENRPRPP